MSIGINAYSACIAQLERAGSTISAKEAAAAEAEPRSSVDEYAAAAVKQNYDVATISEEGKAAEAKRQASLAYDRAWKSWDAMTNERGPNFGSYDPTTGLYKFNMSAADRYFQLKRWKWQENLRANDPEAYEAWVSEHGVMKKPRNPEPDEQDVYSIWDLTPDADGKTALDYFCMKFEEMKNLAALLEEQHREEVRKREEESGEPSAAERLEAQNAELEEDLPTESD